MDKIKVAALALALGLCPLNSKAMEKKIVSMQEVEFKDNERKSEDCVVSAEDEKNFIEKISSKLLECFSKIKINDNSFGVDLGEGIRIDYEMEYTCVKFDEIKEKCNNLYEAKQYLLRQIFDLALDFYFSRPDLMGPMASEEDLKNYHIVERWYNEKIDYEKFDSILSTIDVRNCEIPKDVEQSLVKILGYRRSSL